MPRCHWAFGQPSDELIGPSPKRSATMFLLGFAAPPTRKRPSCSPLHRSSLPLADLYYGVEALAGLSPPLLKKVPAEKACKMASIAASAGSLAEQFHAVSVMTRVG